MEACYGGGASRHRLFSAAPSSLKKLGLPHPKAGFKRYWHASNPVKNPMGIATSTRSANKYKDRFGLTMKTKRSFYFHPE